MEISTYKKFTVLLVDDHSENLVSLQEMLEKEGRFFLTALSGNEALKLILKNEGIGLVMLDVQMPGMDGFEVARILNSNARTKDIAIIFVTAISNDKKFVLQGFIEGAVDYLQKPLDINITRAKVDVFERLYFNQQELKASKIEVERVNHQLERFVYMVSHDLKSPLASIITLLSIIKKRPEITSQTYLQENIDLVYLSCNHLTEMIDAILVYSKQSFLQQALEEVDSTVLVSEVVFFLMPPPHIKVVTKNNLPVLFTRKLKLQQVLQNLISNAMKYMNKEEGIIEVAAVNNDKYYLFSVKDNGPGIAKKDKEKIFNLFEISDNVSNSETQTGVGLNILKIIVEEQGGNIWVDSIPGVGSTFYFEWFKSA